MSRIIGPLAGLGLIALGTGAASAASPVYCALYAKEYVKHAAAESKGSLSPGRVHDRAYSKCLNMDDEPLLPTAYAEPAEAVGGPFVEEEPSAPPVAKTTTADAPATSTTIARETATLEPDRPPLPAKPTPRESGSGLAMWSPEWKAWCAKHFPRSFNPKTGTVIRNSEKPRLTMCR